VAFNHDGKAIELHPGEMLHLCPQVEEAGHVTPGSSLLLGGGLRLILLGLLVFLVVLLRIVSLTHDLGSCVWVAGWFSWPDHCEPGSLFNRHNRRSC
jgi:hypothetical protein